MPDTDKWLVPLVAAGICAAGMAVLVAGIALALGTTGHDWYAAWKLTLVEAMLTAGFDDYGVVEYCTAAGETLSVERYRLAYVMDEAWLARRLIFPWWRTARCWAHAPGLPCSRCGWGFGRRCACGGSWAGAARSSSRRRGSGADTRAGWSTRTAGATAN